MNWITDRIVEPTSWLAVGVGALVLSVAVPEGAFYFLVAAAATAAAGIIMRERGRS
tara:strand:- start:110 stop:277 length:168 start_codon:yes stop_codon:yes gene_type:complete